MKQQTLSGLEKQWKATQLLSDPPADDEWDDSVATRDFLGIGLGVEALTHTMRASAANVWNLNALARLLHRSESRLSGDRRTQGRTAAIGVRAPHARGLTNRESSPVSLPLSVRAPHARGLTNRSDRGSGLIAEAEKPAKRPRSRARTKVEHSIGVIKRPFSFTKVRHRGLAKDPADRVALEAIGIVRDGPGDRGETLGKPAHNRRCPGHWRQNRTLHAVYIDCINGSFCVF